jgi:hypothetical protein
MSNHAITVLGRYLDVFIPFKRQPRGVCHPFTISHQISPHKNVWRIGPRGERE